MTHANLDDLSRLSDPSGFWERMRQRFILPIVKLEKGILPLLLSTTLAEVAGNIVYIVLLERAYQLGGEAVSVGGVLLAQSAPQVLLGLWAGNLVDRFGKRRAAILATVAYAALVAGLSVGQSILTVYILAFLLMLVRLTLTPARLALVSQLSSNANLVATNTALSVVAGLGLFLGPAISAALILFTNDFQVSLNVAGLGLLLSLLPLSFIPVTATSASSVERVNFRQEMRTGWQFMRQHDHVWKVLLCLMHFTLVMGVVTPLMIPLSHNLGLGPEGTGVFFAALGLGGLLGAPLAVVLAKRLGTSMTLLLTGLLTPVGIFSIGLTDTQVGVMSALLLTAMTGGSLNVIGFTVLQRLTPLKIQGRVFGVQQTLMGTVWLVSLAATTGGLVIWPEGVNLQLLFLWVGGGGLGLFLACWFRHWRPITATCEMCEPRIQLLGAVCKVICASPSQVSGAACKVICGSQ
jgi:MFS family permease